MSIALHATQATPAVGAEVRLEGLGLRFDFDRRSRVVTSVLSRVRRIRATSWGLRGIDLYLEPGAGLALIGPTGSGKTSLLRVLAGVMPADEGQAKVRGRVGSLLATEVGLQALLTGREAAMLLGVLAGLSRSETRTAMESMKERTRLGDAFDRPVYTYSEGMRARLHLAVIQEARPDVLLLDEVFEALDHEFRGIVEEQARQLRHRGGIVVAAGHDHEALQRICPRALWLDRGEVRAEGPFSDVVAAYRG
jgi:ABC-2 type transport system ATP-binding protein/lipopolysaccharide transport system ATP-binding protein